MYITVDLIETSLVRNSPNTTYQSEAVVHSQHHYVDGRGVVGDTDTPTFRSVLPEEVNKH